MADASSPSCRESTSERKYRQSTGNCCAACLLSVLSVERPSLRVQRESGPREKVPLCWRPEPCPKVSPALNGLVVEEKVHHSGCKGAAGT